MVNLLRLAMVNFMVLLFFLMLLRTYLRRIFKPFPERGFFMHTLRELILHGLRHKLHPHKKNFLNKNAGRFKPFIPF